jgi:hypothetical protein
MLVASLVQDVACNMLAEDDFVVHPSQSEPQRTMTLPQGMTNESEEFADTVSYQTTWPSQARSWLKDPAEGETEREIMPGMWNTPLELGAMPRMRVLAGWNPDINHVVPPFHPTCLSARSTDPKFNLTPASSEGWEYWVHPDYLDKPYLVATVPGSRVEFELDTLVGMIKVYSLRSRTFGLGTASCWVGNDVDLAVTVDGYWESDA